VDTSSITYNNLIIVVVYYHHGQLGRGF